jgi:hypothetical protein
VIRRKLDLDGHGRDPVHPVRVHAVEQTGGGQQLGLAVEGEGHLVLHRGVPAMLRRATAGRQTE